MKVFDAEAVRQALPMRDAIEAMREAFGQLARGRVEMPLRTTLRMPERGGVVLVMPARCDGALGVGAKIVSVFPEQPVQAVVVLLDATTGRPAAVLEGRSLTAIRTGAASGLATDLLARGDASRVAVIGAGAQARTQLEAVCEVRSVTSATVWSRTRAHAERFAAEMAGLGRVPREIDVAPSAREAVSRADVICTATASPSPVLDAPWVPPGAHVNAVGSFTAEMCELDPALLGEATVVVDQREAAMAEAGEVIAAVRSGAVDEARLIELGDVVLGRAAARTSREEITVFKSVGLAVQDLVAAGRVVAV